MSEGQDVKRLNVALANYDPRELRVQKRYLEEQSSYIHCCGYQNGQELLEELRKTRHYDVIVLGSRLEDMDEMEFLVALRRITPIPPLLLFHERRDSANTALYLHTNGAMQRSELSSLLGELDRMSGRQLTQVEKICQQLYAEWGIDHPDINCGYLTSALRIACGAEQKLALRKELLQQVSEEYHVSVAAVDSGLRRMVNECEAQGSAGWLAFKHANGLDNKKPSIGKLIYAARAQLLLRGARM